MFGSKKVTTDQLETEAPVGIAAPPAPVRLAMTVSMEGDAKIDYVGEPEWAIGVLRRMAEQIEADIA